jgi:hypothetical protein
MLERVELLARLGLLALKVPLVLLDRREPLALRALLAALVRREMREQLARLGRRALQVLRGRQGQ